MMQIQADLNANSELGFAIPRIFCYIFWRINVVPTVGRNENIIKKSRTRINVNITPFQSASKTLHKKYLLLLRNILEKKIEEVILFYLHRPAVFEVASFLQQDPSAGPTNKHKIRYIRYGTTITD
jgi:hypothetical protein